MNRARCGAALDAIQRMFSAVIIGDLHATATELEECRRFFEFLKHIKSENPEALFVWLGDQHHTNDVMSVRVMSFLRAVCEELESVFLVGNHDQVVPGAAEHAMDAYRDLAQVVWPSLRIGPLFFVSHYADPVRFEALTA